jgi:hypothetical protein
MMYNLTCSMVKLILEIQLYRQIVESVQQRRSIIRGDEILANNKHVVLGHSKIHFKTLPRLKKDSLKQCVLPGT